MSNLKMLRDERAEVLEAGRKAVEAANKAMAEDESEVWSEEHQQAVDALVAKREALDEKIAKAEKQADIERAFAAEALPVRGVAITGGTPQVENDPKRGFKNFREFAAGLIKHRADEHGNVKVQIADERLKFLAAPTTVANEGTGADGGFLVPPEFSREIFASAFDDDSLLPGTREIPVSGNGMTFPTNETTPWGTSGSKVYWEGENEQATQTRPQFKLESLRLKKLLGLVPLTQELVDDGSAAAAWVEGEIAPAVRWKVNDALINGSGVEGPLGVVGHGGTVQVNAVSGQNGASIVIENLTGMFMRAMNPMRSSWIANIDTFQHLYDMKDDAGNRIYQTMQPGLSDALPMTLLGRPIRFVEACQSLGTVGDIIFGDWSQYVTITKGGIATDTSMHLWFDYDTLAFRARFRIDGQPWRSTTVSPGYGSNTRGNFVTLETRS